MPPPTNRLQIDPIAWHIPKAVDITLSVRRGTWIIDHDLDDRLTAWATSSALPVNAATIMTCLIEHRGRAPGSGPPPSYPGPPDTGYPARTVVLRLSITMHGRLNQIAYHTRTTLNHAITEGVWTALPFVPSVDAQNNRHVTPDTTQSPCRARIWRLPPGTRYRIEQVATTMNLSITSTVVCWYIIGNRRNATPPTLVESPRSSVGSAPSDEPHDGAQRTTYQMIDRTLPVSMIDHRTGQARAHHRSRHTLTTDMVERVLPTITMEWQQWTADSMPLPIHQ